MRKVYTSTEFDRQCCKRQSDTTCLAVSTFGGQTSAHSLEAQNWTQENTRGLFD